MLKLIAYFFQLFEEFILIIAYSPLGFIRVFLKEKENIHDPKKPTIVIVERWFNRNLLHEIWKKYLSEKGFNVYMKNFPLQNGAFEESAKNLRKYINEGRLKDIILVGISGGALTALTYLQKLNGWNNVKHFITVGAPLKGTYATIPLTMFKSGRELLPKSNFLKNINSDIKNLNKITCIQAKFDEMVPSWSSYIEGAEKIVIDVAGHNNLHMTCKETYETVELITRKCSGVK